MIKKEILNHYTITYEKKTRKIEIYKNDHLFIKKDGSKIRLFDESVSGIYIKFPHFGKHKNKLFSTEEEKNDFKQKLDNLSQFLENNKKEEEIFLKFDPLFMKCVHFKIKDLNLLSCHYSSRNFCFALQKDKLFFIKKTYQESKIITEDPESINKKKSTEIKFQTKNPHEIRVYLHPSIERIFSIPITEDDYEKIIAEESLPPKRKFIHHKYTLFLEMTKHNKNDNEETKTLKDYYSVPIKKEEFPDTPFSTITKEKFTLYDSIKNYFLPTQMIRFIFIEGEIGIPSYITETSKNAKELETVLKKITETEKLIRGYTYYYPGKPEPYNNNSKYKNYSDMGIFEITEFSYASKAKTLSMHEKLKVKKYLKNI